MSRPSYNKRKISQLTMQKTEMQVLIKALLKKMNAEGCGIRTWPNDHKHNIIRLSLADLNILEDPATDTSVLNRCVDCGIEVSKTIAATSSKPKCGSCYRKRQRDKREAAGGK